MDRTSVSTCCTCRVPTVRDVFESGIPEFRISGYETIGNPGSATPYFWHDNQFQYNANATWIKGKHNIRFGLDISRQHMNHLTAEQGAGPRGTFQYTGALLRCGAALLRTSSMRLRISCWDCLRLSARLFLWSLRFRRGHGRRVTISVISGRLPAT